MITGLPTTLPANGGNATTVGGYTAAALLASSSYGGMTISVAEGGISCVTSEETNLASIPAGTPGAIVGFSCYQSNTRFGAGTLKIYTDGHLALRKDFEITSMNGPYINFFLGYIPFKSYATVAVEMPPKWEDAAGGVFYCNYSISVARQ